jgi:hydrogenase maturation protease
MAADGAILVLGVGHPLLADDTAGLRVVEAAGERFAAQFPQVIFQTHTGGAFDLLPLITGYGRVLVVDSIRTDRAPAGHCHEFSWQPAPTEQDPGWFSQHGLNWPQLLAVGRACGFETPEEFCFFAVEGREFERLTEAPTEPVARALPAVLDKIGDRLQVWCGNPASGARQTGAADHESQAR